MDGKSSGLSPWAAGAIVAGVLGVSALVGRRNAPDPLHPEIDRWYHRLSKPAYTPPDPVFGAVWPMYWPTRSSRVTATRWPLRT